MNNRHKKTIAAIFKDPVQSNILWKDIEALLGVLDAELSEGHGSRIRAALNGVRMTFHRPHPRKETDKGAVKSIRRFLAEAGVNHVNI